MAEQLNEDMLKQAILEVLSSSPELKQKWEKDRNWKKYNMAWQLMTYIAKAEGKIKPAQPIIMDCSKIDREWILSTYNDCIKAVEGCYISSQSKSENLG